MTRFLVGASVGVLVLVGFANSQPPQSAPEGVAARPDGADEEAARAAVETAAGAFDDAYNAHDADAVAQLFGERAELTDDDGTLAGRDAIRSAFAEHFDEFPGAAIRTDIERVRFPADGVAIEEGQTSTIRVPGGSEVSRRYLAVRTLRGGSWEIASIREDLSQDEPSSADALRSLEWLVGDWVDESDDSTVETSCRWSDDGNWLLQDFDVSLVGGPKMSGIQRIGWDAVSGSVRSWAFDSEGGFVGGAWNFDGERWTARIEGFASDGRSGSATRVITRLGPDAYLLRSVNRMLDGEPLPDSEVTVVRRPPASMAPKSESKSESEAPPAVEPADGSDTQRCSKPE